MNIEAVGAYIQRLRQKKDMSRIHLAKLVDTTETSLWRIESGKQEPRGPLLFALVQAVEGRIEDVQQLMFDDTATRDDAERLANECFGRNNPLAKGSQEGQSPVLPGKAQLTSEQIQRIQHIVSLMPDELLDPLLNMVEEIQSNPQTILFLWGYLVSQKSRIEEEEPEHEAATPASVPSSPQ
jgi:transcriptional regulator with XRE-family HTH domain